MSHSLVQALRAVPSLDCLDEPTLLGIVGDSANLFWAAGSAVFEPGSPADGLYLVISGSVRVLDAGGTEIARIGAGDFFGELSLLGGVPREHTVEAVQDSELMVVPAKVVVALMAQSPDLAARIRATAEERRARDAVVRD